MTGDNVVKFPTSRVVDCRFVKLANGPSDEAEEIDREWWSVTQALTALRRQEQSLMMRYRHAIKNMTEEQRDAWHAKIAKHMEAERREEVDALLRGALRRAKAGRDDEGGTAA
jgi:truncated hemoglobin YjbI